MVLCFQVHTVIRDYLLNPSFCGVVDYVFGEGNGTHSSTLAWKIPWMEEPGRLQSMVSLRAVLD